MKRNLFFLLCMLASDLLIAQNQPPTFRSTTATSPAGLPVHVSTLQPVAAGETSRPPQIQMGMQTFIIPVVVHIVYNTTAQNISDEQVNSQIASLNKDYRGTNADRSKVPYYFADVAADCGVEFRLAATDPEGHATNGIVRKRTPIKMFGSDNRIKSSAGGGDNPWDRRYYLNIWVGNLAGGMLGYSSLPGCAAEEDGVVIQYTAFGTTGTATAPFNLGRTATHEIGHWLNLRHLWGDAYCGDDEVDDTPRQRSSNRGTPVGEKFTCASTPHGDMYMNFMDLTDDAAMYMFTEGQKRRIRTLFQSYGLRHELVATDMFPRTNLQMLYALPLPADNIFTVFPNPARSSIVITNKSSNPMTNQSVTIFNYTGQPVMRQTMNSSHITVDVSQLKPGLYFIKIGNSKSEPLMKFIRE